MSEVDKDLQEIVNNIDKFALGIDDTFSFKCRGCGKCCKQRDDILLNPKDLYKIARHLRMSIESVVKQYCEVYPGPSSRILLARLISIGGNRRCPFLQDKKCRVHDAKPVVCAMYPIGRTVMGKTPGAVLDNNLETVVGYIKMPIECDYKNKTQTVREWLARWNIPENDQFLVKWTDYNIKMSKFFNMLESRGATEKTICTLWDLVFQIAYIEYDTEKEFEPQFQANLDKLYGVINHLAEVAEKNFRQKESDENGENT